MDVCFIEQHVWFTTEREKPFIRRFSEEVRKCWAWKYVCERGLLGGPLILGVEPRL